MTKSVAYQYDALGRRIGKSVDDNGNGTVDRRESYIYDGAGLLPSVSPTGGEGGRRASFSSDCPQSLCVSFERNG
ncbi:MAG: hypothetical protein JNM43_18480 [Planctomycetaceae bacterium]|nr:hypothetical protein [Planctomycetaceae bacterium]